MQSRMSDEFDNRAQSGDPAYRVYGGRESSRSAPADRPYNLYRSRPRGVRARLRGEEEAALPSGERERRAPHEPGRRNGWAIARRALKYVAIAVIAWLLLSLILFVVSAQIEQGKVPD